MSILIKGVEMPKNCYGCPFFTQVDYWNRNEEADILSKCKRTGEFTWESVNGYLPNCPLVPVPPHGDLIDRDTFIEFIRTHWDSYDQWFCDQLEARPTIIEAEEGET